MLLVAMCCSFTFRPAPAADPHGLQPVVNAMMFPGVETSVVWRKCGEANAFYHLKARTVVLCEELKAAAGFTPGFLRYVLAHELAHGVIIQRDLNYTGSSEWAADELASLVLILTGYEDDVLAGAHFWLNRALPENPFDPHLGDERRGFGMLCLVATKLNQDPFYQCDVTYRRAVRAWVLLLGLDK